MSWSVCQAMQITYSKLSFQDFQISLLLDHDRVPLGGGCKDGLKFTSRTTVSALEIKTGELHAIHINL